MTEQELQQEIHKLYAQDTSYPSSSDDDYLIRRAYLNAAIDLWENYNDTIWNELWTTHSATITSSSSYNLPSDFKIPANYLKVYDSSGKTPTFYPYKKLQDVSLSKDLSTKFFYITGKIGSKVLNINPTPDSSIIGNTLKLDYYKTATKITATTDVPEVPDPYFLIYFTLYKLYSDDGNEQAGVMFQLANEKLRAMKIRNEAVPYYQENTLDDITFGGFGI